MSVSFFILIFLGLVGTAALAFVVYNFVLTRYDGLENSVLVGISAYANEIHDLLDRMFKRQPMNKVYMMVLIPTAVLGLLGMSLGFRFGLIEGLILGGFFGLFGYRLPGVIVRAVFTRRVEKFDRQLVDALNMMANAIKSGLSFMQVVQVIEREMPNPCAEEFGMALKENRVGINLSDALLNMSKRVPSEDLFMIINSVVTLSAQGGDLSEAFDTIATTIRERQRVHEKIRTMAQAGITQATILSLLPMVMLLVQYFVQPAYAKLLFTTPIGIGMLGFMVVLMIGGGIWMKNILTIDV